MAIRKGLIILAAILLFTISCAQEPKSAFVEGTEVRIYLTFNGQKFPTYVESSPWTGPDGVTYNKGDLLPTFKYIQDKLKIKILDTTPKSSLNGRALFEAATSTGFKDADIYNGDPRRISDQGMEGRMIALNKYFDKLPNFAKFLNDNASIKAQLTQDDGNIYMAPYFDDINQLEKMFLMRIDWVKKILDNTSPTFDTTKTIKTVYKGVYDYSGGKKVSPGANNLKTIPIEKNIVAIQNSLSSKDGAALAQALRDYIDKNYMNSTTGYKNRSDLFVSEKAAYDVDEMVALMRAVKTNPQYLTGEDKELIVFYPRDINGSRDAMRRFLASWGVVGTDSRNDHWFVQKDNTLNDARLTDKYYVGIGYLEQLYKEGLILKDFDQPIGTINNFRTYCFQNNNGFMTHDYAASTVSQHDLIPPEDLAKFGTVFEPVVPPAAQWFSNEFEHFSESNRSIKSDGGWGIVSSLNETTLEAALKLLDYPFSEDGLNVMTFGPKGLYWNEYTTVAGKQVPKLIPQFYDDILKQAQGNWSNFLRGFVGATLPTGHVKNTIAIETQISNEHYGNGIERIASSGMTMLSLRTDVSPERRIAPAMVPLTEDQTEALSLNTYSAYHLEWFNRAVKYGFGADLPSGEGKVPTAAEFKAELINKGLQKAVQLNNIAYKKIAN